MSPGSPGWFAAHELRLAWRDWQAMATAGRRRRRIVATLVGIVMVALLHFGAWAVMREFSGSLRAPSPEFQLRFGLTIAFIWCMILAQALEHVVRLVYARADLDLLMASPTAVSPVLAIRILVATLGATVATAALSAPVINAAILVDGPRWLAAYALLASMGASAGAVASVLALGFLRLFGVKHTRRIAQIAVALLGAGFGILVQLGALSADPSRPGRSLVEHAASLGFSTEPGSPIFLPAEAAGGAPLPLAITVAVSLLLLGLALRLTAPRLLAFAHATVGADMATTRVQTGDARLFAPRSAAGWLRAKELRLILRDPWLMSQTLSQVLYLVPPAVALYVGYGIRQGLGVVIAPVLTMIGGQLAGGLGWLSLSAEDAPDLIASAPVPPRLALRAKIEAVLTAVAVPVLPLMIVLGFAAPAAAGVALLTTLAAAATATTVQVLYAQPAARNQFRRRHTASRIANLTESLATMGWAATASLAAAGSLLAVLPLGLALIMLGTAWVMRPGSR